MICFGGFRHYVKKRGWAQYGSSSGIAYQDAWSGGYWDSCSLQVGASGNGMTVPDWKLNTWYTVVSRYNREQETGHTNTMTVYDENDGILWTSTDWPVMISNNCENYEIRGDITYAANQIGRANAGSDFDGDIAGLYAWDRCLTDSEVTAVRNAIIINGTKDDILDLEELFHMLTNFREQRLMTC